MKACASRLSVQGSNMLQSLSWPITPLQPDVRVLADRPLPPLTTEQEETVSRIWAKALTSYPGLYNGRVFCADEITPARIHGHWSEYRRVLAQMKEPDVYGPHILRPLAVVGLMFTPDGIVIGRRAETSIYLPGYWQGAPAGNVESRAQESTIDLAAQLLAECEEELGLVPAECRVGPSLLACEHPSSHIVDIGMRIDVSLTFEDLQTRCREQGNAEYGALHLIRPDHKPEGPMVPTLAALLELS